jgi:hypothetical protein
MNRRTLEGKEVESLVVVQLIKFVRACGALDVS